MVYFCSTIKLMHGPINIRREQYFYRQYWPHILEWSQETLQNVRQLHLPRSAKAEFSAGILNASSWTPCGSYKHPSLSQCRLKFTHPFEEHQRNKFTFYLNITSSWLATITQFSTRDVASFFRVLCKRNRP